MRHEHVDALLGPRPRRGRPERTRARLLQAAAGEFNRHGFHGTDSNRIARAAGYAPAVFYRHFPDKKDAFLAAFEALVSSEWFGVEEALRNERSVRRLARNIVSILVRHHRRWRGLWASMRALIATEPDVRRFHRVLRRRQLATAARLRRAYGKPGRTPEQDAFVLFTIERVCDAVGGGELAELRLKERVVLDLLRRRVIEHLT